MTTRIITLSDYAGAPTLTAECDDTGWNGFHVPFLTVDELRQHMAALTAFQPDRGWDGVTFTTDGEHIVMSTDERDYDSTWGIESEDGRAWIDGLVWQDPATDDEE